jgi:hypothetical protein
MATSARGAAWKLSLGNDGFGRFPQHTPDAIVKTWLDAGMFGRVLRAKLDHDVPSWYRISWATEQLPSMENGGRAKRRSSAPSACSASIALVRIMGAGWRAIG